MYFLLTNLSNLSFFLFQIFLMEIVNYESAACNLGESAILFARKFAGNIREFTLIWVYWLW